MTNLSHISSHFFMRIPDTGAHIKGETAVLNQVLSKDLSCQVKDEWKMKSLGHAISTQDEKTPLMQEMTHELPGYECTSSNSGIRANHSYFLPMINLVKKTAAATPIPSNEDDELLRRISKLEEQNHLLLFSIANLTQNLAAKNPCNPVIQIPDDIKTVQYLLSEIKSLQQENSLLEIDLWNSNDLALPLSYQYELQNPFQVMNDEDYDATNHMPTKESLSSRSSTSLSTITNSEDSAHPMILVLSTTEDLIQSNILILTNYPGIRRSVQAQVPTIVDTLDS